MSQQSQTNHSNLVSIAVAMLLLIITFALIGFVALSVLTGDDFGLGNTPFLARSSPRPVVAAQAQPAGTPDPLATNSFTDKGLGFGLRYPLNWQKSQKGLQVIFSPSPAGLDPANLQDAAIWFGIPVDNTVDDAALLARLQTELAPAGQRLNTATINIGNQPWQSATIQFESAPMGGLVQAMIATTIRHQVGYYLVAVAPEPQWTTINPKFQAIFNSFKFTSGAVLRPTDATPPPTPTATPTPVIYVVQSGDTLGQIAVQFGVDVDLLASRNGIDDPRSLRTGTRLIIPINRSR